MQEGVDLKGDCSRFQVICKIPYPYLGDKWVKARMKGGIGGIIVNSKDNYSINWSQYRNGN